MTRCENCALPLKTGQVRCLNCGTAVAGESARTTSGKTRHSFRSVCGECGAYLPDGCGACLICGTTRDVVPYGGRFPVDPGRNEPMRRPGTAARPARKAPDALRRWAGALTALIGILLFAYTSYNVWRQYFDTGSYRARESIIYQTGSGQLMLSHPGLDFPLEVRGIALQDTAFSDGDLCASYSGRWLAYSSAPGALYLIDLGQNVSDKTAPLEAVKLADSLSEPALFSDSGDYLAYLTKSGVLYSSDMSESRQLDSGVNQLIAVSGQRALYTRLERRGSREDLYTESLSGKSESPHLVGRGIDEVLDWTPGFEKLVFTGVEYEEENEKTLSVFEFDLKQNSTVLLAMGAGRVVDASAAESTAVYIVEKPLLFSYNMFIDDDMYRDDARITKPLISDYPILSEAVAQYGESADFADLEENEELIEQNIAYKEALRKWEDKAARDEIRRRLHLKFAGQRDYLRLCDLYVSRRGVVTLLDTGVWAEELLSREQGGINCDEGYILYGRVDSSSLRRIKFSDIWSGTVSADLDLKRHFLSGSGRELMYSRLDGTADRLYIRGGGLAPRQWVSAPQSGGVYFTMGAEAGVGPGELYFAEHGTGSAVRVASGVAELLGTFRDGALYSTETQNGKQTLYFVKGAVAEAVGGSDSKLGSVENNGSTLLYYDAYDEDSASGALHMVSRETRLLLEGASDYDYLSDQLVYIRRQNAEKGVTELYVWNSGRAALLQEGFKSCLSAHLPGLDPEDNKE